MRYPLFSLLAVLTAGTSACHDKPYERIPLKVEVVRVNKSDAASTFEATGEVRAKVESDMSFRTSGKVVERNFDVGDRVPAGALLARLDPQQQRADVDVAKAAVDSAQAAFGNAELELKREKNLFAQEATPKAALDAKEEAMLVAKGQLASARANLAAAHEQLSYTELRAARPGIITTRSVEIGQVVPAGTTAYGFSEEGERDAVFRIHETIAARLDAKTQLALHLTDKPDVRASGIVREISPIVDATTASVLVKVTIVNPPKEMELRAPIVAQLQLTAARTVILPAWAIFSDNEGKPAVWIVNGDDKKVSLRRIQIGTFESRSIVVTGGLADGELVVARGSSRLRPGQPVQFDEGSKS